MELINVKPYILNFYKFVNHYLQFLKKNKDFMKSIEYFNIFIDENEKIKSSDQIGGSELKTFDNFNNYFKEIIDINNKPKDNINISENKVRLNNLLFYSHILFIINFTNFGSRQIISHINKSDTNKYYTTTNILLEIIKKKDNIIGNYFLKYHYFNLKIVNKFLEKLINLWYDPKENDCNKFILDIYKENKEINNYVYFNLLDINYSKSLKKAIFIFFGFKTILDNLIKSNILTF
jgi:hypothetical protein